MDIVEFKEVVNMQFTVCRNILKKRAETYAPGEDRLSNFKKAAVLQNVIPENALYGMVTKHIVALGDTIYKLECGELVEDDLFEELVTDIINYMLLLRALTIERLTTSADE